MRADLVQDALAMAITLRGDCRRRSCSTRIGAPSLGSTQNHGLRRGQRADQIHDTGICWDNSMAESFFATLKTEFTPACVVDQEGPGSRSGRGSRTGTTGVAGTPRSVRSPRWRSNCNTHARSRTLNGSAGPSPRRRRLAGGAEVGTTRRRAPVIAERLARVTTLVEGSTSSGGRIESANM